MAVFRGELVEMLFSLPGGTGVVGAARATASLASVAFVLPASAAGSWAQVVGRARRKGANSAVVPVSRLPSLFLPRRARVALRGGTESRVRGWSSTPQRSAQVGQQSARLSALGRVPPRAAVSLSVGAAGGVPLRLLSLPRFAGHLMFATSASRKYGLGWRCPGPFFWRSPGQVEPVRRTFS